MKVLSLQHRLDQKKLHTDLQAAATALGGTVTKEGKVLLEKEIAIVLAQLLGNLEEHFTADTIPPPPEGAHCKTSE